MKIIIALICGLCLTLVPGNALAKKTDKGQGKGPMPNESAYEHASDNAKFKRGADWQGGQGKQTDDENEALDEKGKKSKDQERERETHTKQKSKGEHGDADMDDAGTKKMKKSDADEDDDAEAGESGENRERDRDKEQYSKQKSKGEPGENAGDAAGKKKIKKSE